MTRSSVSFVWRFVTTIRLIQRSRNRFPYVAHAMGQSRQFVSLNTILVLEQPGFQLPETRWELSSALPFGPIQPRVNDGCFIPLAERKSGSPICLRRLLLKTETVGVVKTENSNGNPHVPVQLASIRVKELSNRRRVTRCASQRVDSVQTELQAPHSMSSLFWVWGLPFSVDGWKIHNDEGTKTIRRCDPSWQLDCFWMSAAEDNKSAVKEGKDQYG